MLIGNILINILTLFYAFNRENRMAYSEFEGSYSFHVVFFSDVFLYVWLCVLFDSLNIPHPYIFLTVASIHLTN